MPLINEKTLEYLGQLARIDLSGMDEEKMLADLQSILSYFEELKEVNTENIEPMAGGTIRKNIFREDDFDSGLRESAPGRRSSAPVEAFPEKEGGFLKVPQIFG